MILVLGLISAFLGWWSWLTIALLVPALFMLDLGFLFAFFLAVMRLQEMRDAGLIAEEIMPIVKAIFWFGLLLDFLFNMTWDWIVFLGMPREWLVSSRIERHAHGEGWRKAVALWFAAKFLNPGDPSGKHIH